MKTTDEIAAEMLAGLEDIDRVKSNLRLSSPKEGMTLFEARDNHTMMCSPEAIRALLDERQKMKEEIVKLKEANETLRKGLHLYDRAIRTPAKSKLVHQRK